MEREGHEGDKAFYLTAWDGTQSYTYDRIGRGTVYIPSAIVSVLGTIQPGVISDYLRQAVDGGRGDDGMIQRFQLAVWPDMPGRWINVDREPDLDAQRAAWAAFRRLHQLTPEAIGAQRDSHRPDALPFLRFDATGQELFDTWRSEFEQRLRGGLLHPAMEAHLAKYKKLVPALTLILHAADQKQGPIEGVTFLKALRWADYLESHAIRLYAHVSAGTALAARELGRRITGGDLPEQFTARDVYSKHWAGLDRKATSAHSTSNRPLMARGAADSDRRGPRVLYRVNPRVDEPQKEQSPVLRLSDTSAEG